MPKPRSKPEPMTPDEVMASPALQGFDTFLRYRPGDASPITVSPMGDLPVGQQPTQKTPLEQSPPDRSPVDKPPIGKALIGKSQATAISPGIPPVPVFQPPPKVRRALRVRDGHSTGEHALYQALWNAAMPENPESRLICIGYGGMQSLCGLDKSNCKDNMLSLIHKLAVEIVSGFSVERNHGNT